MTFARSIKFAVCLTLTSSPLTGTVAHADPNQSASIDTSADHARQGIVQPEDAARESLVGFVRDFRALDLSDKVKAVQSLQAQMNDVRDELTRQTAKARNSQVVPDDDTTVEVSNGLIVMGLIVLSCTAAIGLTAKAAMAIGRSDFFAGGVTDRAKPLPRLLQYQLSENRYQFGSGLMTTYGLVGVTLTMAGMAHSIYNARKIKLKDADALIEAAQANAVKLQKLADKYEALERATR